MESFYDQVNLKRVAQIFLKHITDPGINQVKDILYHLFSCVFEPDELKQIVKSVDSETGSGLLLIQNHDFEHDTVFKDNLKNLLSYISEENIVEIAITLALRARYRFFGRAKETIIRIRELCEDIQSRTDEIRFIQERKDIIRIKAIKMKNKSDSKLVIELILFHAFATVTEFLDQIFAQRMAAVAYTMNENEESRYEILAQVAPFSATSAMIAADHYSNTGRELRAALLYSSNQSEEVRVAFSMFLRKTRQKQIDGIISEEVFDKIYEIAKSGLDQRARVLVNKGGSEYEFLKKVKAPPYRPENRAIFRLCYCYGILGNEIASNVCLSMLEKHEIELGSPIEREIKMSLTSVVQKKLSLMHLEGITTGLVNDLVERHSLNLPFPAKEINVDAKRMGTDELEELIENLNYLEAFFSKSAYNKLRLRYFMHLAEFDANRVGLERFELTTDLTYLAELIRSWPKSTYRDFAIDFYYKLKEQFIKQEEFS